MPANAEHADATSLNIDIAESLIRKLTDGLVNIRDEEGKYLLRLNDGTVIDTKGWGGWEWTHGIALTGLYHHARLHRDTPVGRYSLKTAVDWFEHQYKVTEGRGAPKNINTTSPFYALTGLLADGLIERDDKWMKWLDEWGEWVMRDLPRTPEGGFQHITYSEVNERQLWDDTLMMTVIPLARVGILLNRPAYIEEAKYQFLLHIQYLADPKTSLFFHGWEFYSPTSRNRISVGHNFANALWARGNCWITLAIPLFLEILDEGVEGGLERDDSFRRHLEGAFRRQVDALVKTQEVKGEGKGLWHTLLLDPGSYAETSASAGFAAGIFAGIRLGMLSGDQYLHTGTTALQACIAQIQPDGQVANTSFGTSMGYDLDHYRNIAITSMPYGQSLVQMGLVEWERLRIGAGPRSRDEAVSVNA